MICEFNWEKDKKIMLAISQTAIATGESYASVKKFLICAVRRSTASSLEVARAMEAYSKAGKTIDDLRALWKVEDDRGKDTPTAECDNLSGK